MCPVSKRLGSCTEARTGSLAVLEVVLGLGGVFCHI